MVQVADKMGVRARIPKLIEYVEHRDAVLQRIAVHFGVEPGVAKYAVLIVLNGGSVLTWIKDIGLQPGFDPHVDLRDLEDEALIVRDAFFSMTERDHPGAIEKLKQYARARKGSGVANAAINRSVFSHCIFEVEDKLLEVVDEYFRSNGWGVDTLSYDGAHVQHRADDMQDPNTLRWVKLEASMREAEAAVLNKTGYRISLCEKPLFMADATQNTDDVEHPES